MSADTIVEQRTRPGSSFTRTSTLDRIRFVAAFLTVVFGLPLSDVTVVDGEKVVLQCCVTVAPTAEVTWYVDTSFTVRGLRADTDYYFRLTRSSVTLSWLAPTSNGGAEIVAHVIEQSRVPVTDVDARRAGQAAD